MGRSRALSIHPLITECLLVLAATAACGAGPTPEQSPPFELLPPGVFRTDVARPQIARALSARHPGFRRFAAEHPGRWRADWDEGTGVPHRIYGDVLPLGATGSAGSAPGPAAGDRGLEAAVRRLLDRHRDLFPVDTASLEVEASRDLGTFRVLRFRQTHRGIPVLGSRVEARVAPGGRLIHLGCDVLPQWLLDRLHLEPRFGAEQAEAVARAHAGPGGVGPATSRELAIVPLRPGPGPRLAARLAWVVRAGGGDTGEHWVYLVAADAPARGPAGGGIASGEILGRWDRASRATAAGVVRGKATPGLLPDVPWNPPQTVPVPGLEVQAGGLAAVTGPDGGFRIDAPGDWAVTVTATALQGPFCRVENMAGPDLSFSVSAEGDEPIAVELNSLPSEHGTAQVNAFLEVNRAHDFIKTIDPAFDAIDVPVRVQVNIDDSCNAFFVPEENGILGFFHRSSCVNSAYSTVIHHEYTHFVAWKVFGAASPMPAYTEGISDAFAALLTDQPVIGHDFNGAEGPGGTPMRDLSGPLSVYPDDLLRAPHTAGLILAGAVWDLRGKLGDSLGSAAGLDIARRLWLGSLLLAPLMISPDLTLDFLELDDDDGVLADGTPHFQEIADAFSRHGLPPPGSLEVAHVPLDDSAGPGPFAVEVSVRSDFDFLQPVRVTLRVSSDGGFAYGAIEMIPAGESTFRAEIPAQPKGTTVRYWIEAEGTGGARAVFPEGAPRDGTAAFAVGEAKVLFADDFDGSAGGWIHGTIHNGNPENRDDWQRGAPERGTSDEEDPIDGNLLDPPAAFSPPNCWGNDLGLGGRTNRKYSSWSSNYLESPPIDCTGRLGVHLRFQRWLTVERNDTAVIRVNGAPVWQSAPSRDRDTLDMAWRPVDLDISSAADGQAEVRIRFELSTGFTDNAGGWTIDDVKVVETGIPIPQPFLEAIEPRWGPLAGGIPFVLRGAFFPDEEEDATVQFGDRVARDITIRSRTEIAGIVPPGQSAATVDLRVTTPAGSAVLPGGFRYFAGDPPRFVRGDANLDGEIDISDAILILDYLFIGRHTLGCPDAADVNDDEALDISDPVGLLAFLFLGGRPPRFPYPDPGPDLTDDPLDCARGLGGP